MGENNEVITVTVDAVTVIDSHSDAAVPTEFHDLRMDAFRVSIGDSQAGKSGSRVGEWKLYPVSRGGKEHDGIEVS